MNYSDDTDIVKQIIYEAIKEYANIDNSYSKSAQKLCSGIKEGKHLNPDWVLKALCSDFEEATSESS